VDERADVFGLGAILCEILTGQPPFLGKRAEAQRKSQLAQLDDAYARLEGCGAEAELVDLAKRCLAVEPWERPRDAGQVAAAVTAYQESVAERLHQAELAQAAEAARAEEARATAAAAEAKARAERRARGLTVALAASVLLAGGLGAAGWRWVELERIDRAAALKARVNTALQEAVRLRGLAQGATEGNLAPWTEAVAAAKNLDALLEPEVNPVLRQQTAALLAEVTAEEQQAAAAVRAAERDRVLLDRLLDIRSAKADDRDGWATDAAYAEAFRTVGLDVAALSPAEAGAQLRARPAAVVLALAAALDDWAAVRRDKRKDAAGAKRLTEAAQVADPDPWRQELRAGLEQRDRKTRLTALRALAQTARLDELSAVSLDLLGQALNAAGDAPAAETVLRAAQQRHPGDIWVNYDLAGILRNMDRREEAIRYYVAARALRPETAHELAHALESKGELDEAIAVFQDLVRLRPRSGHHLSCLGNALQARGRAQEARTVLDAAIAANREDLRLRPDDARAHLHLGNALKAQGKMDDAVVAYREAMRLQPNMAYRPLGTTLRAQGKLDEAIAVYREAIRLRPNLAGPRVNLGAILCDIRHDYGTAVDLFREAVRLEPGSAVAHSNLGEALANQGKLDEAIAAFREVIRFRPDYAIAHCGLGHCLRRKGQYADALASLQRGHELGSKPPGWKLPSAEWVRQAEQMIAFDPKLPALLKGQAQPADAGERLSVAQMCADRAWYVAAARFWADAFAQNPKRGDDLQTGNPFLVGVDLFGFGTYHAARAAAQAGAGKTQDAPPPDDATRALLRQQARAWLQADLAAYANCLDGDDPRAPVLVREQLESWKYDPKLAGLRDEAALSKLPAEEREACRQLWAEVEAVLKRTADR
jgi:tetratricopeptide (TPR) repeat protein